MANSQLTMDTGIAKQLIMDTGIAKQGKIKYRL